MLLAVDTQNIVGDIISSYETRIQGVEALFQTTHQILQGFQDSVLDTRQEQERINGQLRESLAQNGSLRKKDFDKMMSVISSHQDQEEQEARNLSKSYLNEQTNFVQELRESLRNFTEALAGGEVQRVKEFHSLITEIFARQEQRKNEVVSKLKEYQKDQQDMARMLNELLAKGRELRTRDLKSMLSEFQRGRNERIAHQEERRGQVKGMLGEFKAKRVAAEQNRLSRCQVE
jgi:ClpP class serine protease